MCDSRLGNSFVIVQRWKCVLDPVMAKVDYDVLN